MTPSQIKKYAAKYGVDFSVEGSAAQRTWNVECWSPKGKRWMATMTHFLALPGDGYYTRPDWEETYAALKGAVEFGFEDCDDQECDVCHE